MLEDYFPIGKVTFQGLLYVKNREGISCSGDRDVIFFLDARDKVEPSNRPQRIWNSRWRRDAKTRMEDRNNAKCQMHEDVKVDYQQLLC